MNCDDRYCCFESRYLAVAIANVPGSTVKSYKWLFDKLGKQVNSLYIWVSSDDGLYSWSRNADHGSVAEITILLLINKIIIIINYDGSE